MPYTVTGQGGQGYTHWNLGKVPAGGVVDSWHGEGGPGKFEAHNDGDVAAYVYLPAGEHMPFDVKFWAPYMSSSEAYGFTFRVEAASFPLWEHDIEVQ